MKQSHKQRQFDALARRYANDLYRFAFWLCKDPTLATDLVQETYLRAWRSINSLRDEKAAKSWLLTILRREFARLFERKQLPLCDMDDLELADDFAPDPEQRAEARNVRRAMAGLDEKYREPLVLQVLGGFSCQEIAKLLGQTRGAVMTQLFRARQQLKVALEASEKGLANVHELN